MRMLDLFAGLGGASQAMRERGWDVITVELDPRFAPDVVADIREYRYDGPPLDLIWASPPCTEFARESMPWCKTGQEPDLGLVAAALRVIAEARPRWWILENVRGAQAFLGPAKWVRNPVFLWGEFPAFDAEVKPWKERLGSRDVAKRAAMPAALSLAVAVAVEGTLNLGALDVNVSAGVPRAGQILGAAR